ncbi:glyoxalase/bleomycin resistance/dioxygenase family protein [Streptomyces sp. NPDC054956]
MDSPAAGPATPTDAATGGEPRPSAARLTLLVLYTPRLEDCRRFYAELGLAFTPERHGRGPEHYAAVLADGTVFELYPDRDDRRTGDLRLGLAVGGGAAIPPLAPGRHRRVDPDGRTVEIDAF